MTGAPRRDPPADRAPRWARALLRRLAPSGHADDVLGDLEEAHRARLTRRTLPVAALLTGLDALDMALSLLRSRRDPGHRAIRGRRGLPGPSWLDVKLGARMLVRYPGLTLIGGLSMAFGIWIGTVSFEFASQIQRPEVPLEEGERVVGIQQLETLEGQRREPSLEDYRRWRETFGALSELGAFRARNANLSLDGGAPVPEQVAEITASGLELTRVSPLLGRSFTSEDERPGGPDVVLIGHQLWQTRFEGDPDVVGTTVRLGGALTTVVGVMPEEFWFPVAHNVWVPLRLESPDTRVQVFGRLADGVTLEQAQAELTALGAAEASEFPQTHADLQPQLLSYPRSILSVPQLNPDSSWMLRAFMTMLLLIVCGNVALLLFARILTREGEILVRSALGASRGRIIGQLFMEALALGVVSGAVGLALAGAGLSRLMETLRVDLELERMPFWYSAEPEISTVVYALGLTVLAAVVAGVLPALRITGRRAEGRLRAASAGSGGLQIGGMWTVVIVAQVAVTVAFPPSAFLFHRYAQHQRGLDLGFASDEYVTARLEAGVIDGQPMDGQTLLALQDRLLSDPAVTEVTFSRVLPGMFHPQRYIELEGDGPGDDVATESGDSPAERYAGVHRVGEAWVDVGFVEALDMPVLAGRSFRAADLGGGGAAVLVNESFVEHVLDGRNAVGRRLRYVSDAQDPQDPGGDWYEIVGVVPDAGVVAGDFDPRDDPGFYRPTASSGMQTAYLLARVPGDAEAFVPRLRQTAADVDPTLRIYEPAVVQTAVRTSSGVQIMEFMSHLVALGSAIGLLLSLAGIYSVMSYTVSRRTREIGVRVALGADPFAVVRSIFWRPLVRVVVGIALGGVLATWLSGQLLEGMTGGETLLVAVYSALMLGVCLLACVVPTRRALNIEPTEALRAEG